MYSKNEKWKIDYLECMHKEGLDTIQRSNCIKIDNFPIALYRYRPLYTSSNILCIDKIIEKNKQEFSNIEKKKIWLSNPEDFNDPFEGYHYIDYSKPTLQILGKLNPFHWEQQFIEFENKSNEEKNLYSYKITMNEMSRRMLACCFSTSCDNILMWSHYTNQHQGFCIKYDCSKMSLNIKNNIFFPIIYRNEMIDLSLLPDLAIKTNLEIPKLYKANILKYIIKSNCWSYENEWRYLIPTLNGLPGYSNLQEFSYISDIYLGLYTSDENIQKLKSICENNGYGLYKPEKPFNRFSIDFKKIL